MIRVHPWNPWLLIERGTNAFGGQGALNRCWTPVHADHWWLEGGTFRSVTQMLSCRLCQGAGVLHSRRKTPGPVVAGSVTSCAAEPAEIHSVGTGCQGAPSSAVHSTEVRA